MRWIVLVGHGAPPSDAPRELVSRLKQLEGRRRAAGTAMCEEERRLDEELRRWPRTAANDPYGAGVRELATALRPLVGEAQLEIAFNEFCAPSLSETIERAAAAGATEVVIVPTMLTPGGVHSEVEIPEEIEALSARFVSMRIRYAWPFDLGRVASLLAERIAQEWC
jgi:sirohydrochlorin cobaltochelatase